MNYLTAENLSKNYGEKVLFDDLTFHVNEGEKIAIIAKNGTGKSSLIRVIVGEEKPEKGGKVLVHKEIRMAYLPQQPVFETDATVMEAIMQSEDPRLKIILEYEKAIEENADDAVIQHVMSEMDNLQAWDIEAKVKKILYTLKIQDLNQAANSLSGGQQKRLALARILISEPDFLILDEPTNHLDLDMIEWLEEYLQMPSISLFMVTHDRYFMENICNEIWELEGGIIYKYKGNYSNYLEKRAERKASEMATVDKAKNLLTKELDWMRRMPSARGTKAKARIDAFYSLEEVASKKLEEKQVELEVNMPRLGGKIAEFHHVSKSYGGKKLIDNFSYKFIPGEKVGIVGKNGMGKSTLLNMLTGRDQPDTGKIVIGDTIKIGYYDQQNLKLSGTKKAIDVIREIADYIPLNNGKMLSAGQLMERFLFEPSQQYTFVSKLSGGEQRRLYLMTILMSNPNFIILDEPTNDLDVVTLQVLEDFLQDFKGCIIIVSHDRFFMDKMVDHIFVLEGAGVVKDFPGNYSQYRNAEDKKLKESKKTTTPEPKETIKIEPTVAAANKEKKKLSYKEKMEWEQLDQEIPKMEIEKKEIERKMAEMPDYETIRQLTATYESLSKTIDQKTERWLALSEYND